MKYNMAIFKKHFNKGDKKGTGLHDFIAHYISEYKYELVKKLGFNLKKFKSNGGELFISSMEIDFNYPVQPGEQLIVKVEFLDILDSRVRIKSFLRNTNGSLIATAVSTIIMRNNGINNDLLNLDDYFKIVEEEVEEYAN